jgi:CO/xanthine dehydrogenase Mo-binding subunit
VRVDRRSGAVTVEKLTLVIDAGTLVHPDGALAQVEGSALWGLSMALYEGTEFVKGQVKDTNFDSYTPLRIGDVPELDIEFIESVEAPVGLGDPGTTVVAPAIGNAIFAATGDSVASYPDPAGRCARGARVSKNGILTRSVACIQQISKGEYVRHP